MRPASRRSLVMVVLVVSVFVRPSCAQGCPSSCGCFGAFVSCQASGMTRFPLLPLTIQQTVEELNLMGNMIVSIFAEDLENYTSLRQLDLSINNISYIEPDSFANTAQLREINLEDNQLTEIPDDLFANTQLQILNLRQNQIQNISAATFTGLSVPSTIRLNNNLIRTIPNGTFSDLGFIQVLNLDGNPLRCDCQLRWLPSFLESRSSPLTTITTGSCNSPPTLSGTSAGTLTESQLLCDCDPTCVNGTCDLLVGDCRCEDGYNGGDCGTACPSGTYGAGCLENCTCVSSHESSPCDNVNGTCYCLPGYTGSSCESVCPPGRYGLGCVEECTCETGNCHHITGDCSCPIRYFGANCSHNCTGASDCSDLGRRPCSLDTPEHTCASCLLGYVGEHGDGNTHCILCSGAPDCTALNRYPCSEVPNTCGSCFSRHLGAEGFSNQPCFDPCVDGIMNYNETDVDCGGSLCPPCELGDSCTSSEDCGSASVCLGVYIRPSLLDYPFDIRNSSTCECPNGSYGQDCLEQCQCQSGSSWDFITGMCNCTTGWTGVFSARMIVGYVLGALLVAALVMGLAIAFVVAVVCVEKAQQRVKVLPVSQTVQAEAGTKWDDPP